MKRTKLGFTLVELLVVITIIGILMGLLIPAVNSARETARRNQCATNMKNLALAGVQYENTKGSMPGWVTKFGFFAGGVDPSDLGNFGGSVPAHVKVGGFGVTMLPWLDAQPTYEHWTQDRYPIVNDGSGDLDATTGSSGDGFHELAAPNLAIFQCPSNPVSSGSHAKNSYVSNNGMSHIRTTRGHDGSNAGTLVATYDGSQTKANGVFTAKYLGLNSMGSMMGTGPSIGLDDMKDGQGFTVLFSENVQATPWHRPGFIAQGSPAATALGACFGKRRHHGFASSALLAIQQRHGLALRRPSSLGSELLLPHRPAHRSAAVTDVLRQHRINGGGTTVQEDIFNLQMTDNFYDAPSLARPSSAHIDGVNAAFADGATRFISDSVDYRVQQAVMTPRGKSSNVPWQEFVLTDELGQ